MNIYLLGFMGSGKSTVGKLLAGYTQKKFLDLDLEIEKTEGASIFQVFETKGESYFRLLEHNELKKTFQYDDLIVSTGGGTPCFHNNIELILQNGFSIFLNAPFKNILSHIKSKQKKRPLLKNKTEKEIEELLNEREKHYNKARLTINTASLTAEETAKKIMALLK